MTQFNYSETYTKEFQRILLNKTASDADLDINGKVVTIPAGGQEDLAMHFDLRKATRSQALIDLLNQGTDDFQIYDGVTYHNQADGLQLMQMFIIDDSFNTKKLEGNNSLYHRTVTNHVGNNHQVLYINNSGNVEEIAVGQQGFVLISNGDNYSPSFQSITQNYDNAGKSFAEFFYRPGNKSNTYCYSGVTGSISKYQCVAFPTSGQLMGCSFEVSSFNEGAHFDIMIDGVSAIQLNVAQLKTYYWREIFDPPRTFNAGSYIEILLGNIAVTDFNIRLNIQLD